MNEQLERYVGAAIALSRLGVHIARTFAERLEPLGLSTSHAAVLRLLGHNQHCSHQELGRQLGLSAYRISQVVGALESAEILALGSGEHANTVELTDKGREVYAEVIKAAVAFETELLAGLSDDEAATLRDLLRRLEDNVGLDQPETPVAAETLAVTLPL